MSTISRFLDQAEHCQSLFENAIRKLDIPTCKVFLNQGALAPVAFKEAGIPLTTKDTAAVNAAFPNSVAASQNQTLVADSANPKPATGKRVAVLFSGGPAAGGHNVIAGLFRILGAANTLLGVKAGPKGLIQGDLFDISAANIDQILNTGGFDFLGSDRTKIKTDAQFDGVRRTCVKHNLDAIVVIGGDDSNTNAAVLAEKLYSGVKADGSGVQVIGAPKTIDGDLQIGDLLPISFGFDTATKIYAEMVGNILQDTPSSRKYWHFIKIMGRAASHVALEVALQTKPAVTLISEEVAEKQLSLAEIVDSIAKTVIQRAADDMNYGVVLIPEGLIEFIPEMTALLQDLNDKLAEFNSDLAGKTIAQQCEFICGKLKPEHAKLMASLPDYIVDMLMAERDSHGNLQVSLIPTERLLIDMTAARVKALDGSVKFHTLNHFFGYEGRCGAPTLFDAAYTYNLGLTVGSLILAGKTGFIASIKDLDQGGTPLALPLTGLLNIERRHGHDEMVIEKALVKTSSPAFQYFAQRRAAWAAGDCFCSPGPRQLWGPASRQMPLSVALNRDYASMEFEF